MSVGRDSGRAPIDRVPQRLRSRTGLITAVVVVLLLAWIGYLFVGIATDRSIRSASSVPQLARMVQTNVRAHDGKDLQTHFAQGTISADYGTDFVDKLDDDGLTRLRVVPGKGFVALHASGDKHPPICAAWDVTTQEGQYVLDPTPSTNPAACPSTAPLR